MIQKASRRKQSTLQVLDRLSEEEARARYTRLVARRTRLARVPVHRSLDDFDFHHPKKVGCDPILRLFDMDLVEKKSDECFTARSGLGKTHLASALCRAYIAGEAGSVTPAVEAWARSLLDNALDAPVQLVHIADDSRLREVQRKMKSVYAAVHSGFIGQNAYLFCVSRGLAAGFRETVDREALTRSLQLRDDPEIAFAQTVGHSSD